MSNPIIETDLAEVLSAINTKLDKLQGDVTDLKIGQTELKGNIQRLEVEVKGDIQQFKTEIKGEIGEFKTESKSSFKTIDAAMEVIKTDIKEIKGSQKMQIWALIGILITAVGGFLAAVGRSVFSLS